MPVQDRMFSDELCYREDGNCTTANLLLLPSFGDLARVAVAAWDAVFGAPAVSSGEWVVASEAMSARAAAYQFQISGRAGQVFVRNGVKFDGFTNGVLLEAAFSGRT